MSVWAPQTPADPGAELGFTETPKREGKAEPEGTLRALGSAPKGEIGILSLPWGLSLPPAGRWSRGITSKGSAELSLAARAGRKGRWRWVSICGSCASQLPCTPSFVLFYCTKRQNKQASHDFTPLWAHICLQEKPPKATRFPFYLPPLSLLIFLWWKVTQPWLGINPARNKNPSWILLHYKWIVNVLNKSVKMEIQK